MYSNKPALDNGFTLVELMITLLISVFVSAGIYWAYTNQQNIYRRQEAVVDLQQNIRSGIYLISQELRMAGYDFQETGIPGITAATASSITFTQDLDGNGDILGLNENVTLIFDNDNTDGDGCDANNPCIQRDTGGGEQPFIDNVQFLEFLYTIANDPLPPIVRNDPTPAQLNNIQAVQVSMLVRSATPEDSYWNVLTYDVYRPPGVAVVPAQGPYNDNRRRRMLTTTVQLRNAAL